MRTNQIQEVSDLLLFDLSSLEKDSNMDGHRHISRLIDEYKSGKNRFSKPGEALFIATEDQTIVGVCGINQDPYNDQRIGRLRRLYVLREFRRYGIGRMLVESVIKNSKGKFEKLILRTDNPVACEFYKSLGFKEITEMANTTHIIELEFNHGDNKL